MAMLDYVTREARIHRRTSGTSLLTIALATGAIAAALPGIFGPIHLSYGTSESPLQIFAALSFLVLVIMGVHRRIEDDNGTGKGVATTAILATAVGFAEQFGWAARTRMDTARLAMAVFIVIGCSFWFAIRHRTAVKMGVVARSPEPRLRRWARSVFQRRDMVVLGIIAVAFGIWPWGSQWISQWKYSREAREWYELARNHQFPAMSLQYSEDPADLKLPGLGTGLYRYFVVDPLIECRAFLGDLYSSPETIFVHELRKADGQRAVVTAELTGRMLDVGFWELLEDGRSIVRGQRLHLEDEEFQKRRELRIFSGQIDHQDPSRFFVPFQTRNVRGRLVVQWVGDWPKLAPEPDHAELTRAVTIKIQEEIEAPP